MTAMGLQSRFIYRDPDRFSEVFEDPDRDAPSLVMRYVDVAVERSLQHQTPLAIPALKSISRATRAVRHPEGNSTLNHGADYSGQSSVAILNPLEITCLNRGGLVSS